MRSTERRLVALQETVWHTLLTLENSATLWTAKRVQNPSFARRENHLVVTVVSSASRPQGRWSPPTGGRRTDRDALQVGTAAREERMHPQPRQRDRREWRDDPTRTNTSGRSHHVTVEGREKPDAHSHSRTWRLYPSWLPARAASTHSPCSVATVRGREGLHGGSKNRHRLQTERAGEVTSQTAWVASSARLSVSSLLAWMSLGEVESVTKQVGERSHTSADILVCRRQGLNTLCTLFSCDGLEDEAAGRGDRTGGGTQEMGDPHEVSSARGSVALKLWVFSQSMT
ncbi:hypothetical protein WA556_000898 [Blastocystis sp. ATCC 50177/Nand II]